MMYMTSWAKKLDNIVANFLLSMMMIEILITFIFKSIF